MKVPVGQVGKALKEEREEEDVDDEPPVGFISPPRNAEGKICNADNGDVDVVKLALTNMDNQAQILAKMAGLGAYLAAVIKRIKVMVALHRIGIQE
ncbi:hypothetical protein BDC45DRAFT_605957 [Circinella umbellata]|nr:hypothetical protein BDC45DRAFT_605957 [Circinella umbellata]